MNFVKNKNKFTNLFNGSQSKSGFTLLELLVVISIIALLSSIVIGSVNSARANARDAERMTQLREINNAIQLYISDFGYAPGVGCDSQTDSDTACFAVDTSSSWDVLASELSAYIPELPSDPCGENCPGAGSGNDPWFSYKYYSPSNIRAYESYCDENICSGTVYQLRAQTLEGDGNSYIINNGYLGSN